MTRRVAASREVDCGGSCLRFLRHTAASSEMRRFLVDLLKGERFLHRTVPPVATVVAAAAAAARRSAGDGTCRGGLVEPHAKSERGVGPTAAFG